MKNLKTIFKSLIVFLIFFSSMSSYAQDVITKKDGTDIQAKILEVTPTEIKYKRFDNQTGPTFSSLISDLIMVRYENGTNEVFNQNKSISSSSGSNEASELIEQGKQDAINNYKGQNSGKGWTAATTILFSPIIGVIPAAITTSSEPENENLNAPSLELMKNPNYNQGYTDQAHKTKKKKIWKSFGIASGVWLAIIIAANAADVTY